MPGDRRLDFQALTKASFFSLLLLFFLFIFLYICVLLNLKFKNMKLSLLMQVFGLSDSEIKDLLLDYSSKNLDRRNRAAQHLTRYILSSFMDDCFPSGEDADLIRNSVFSPFYQNSFVDIDASRLNKADIEALGNDDEAVIDYLIANGSKVEIFVIVG